MKGTMIKLIKQELVSNARLKEIMGDHINELITFKPSLNITELNEKFEAKHFITISINNAMDSDNSSQILLKVGVAISLDNARDEDLLEVFDMVKEVIKSITTRKLIYDNPEQIDFSEMSESFFDEDSTTWGYILMFVTNDARLQTLATT